MNDFVKRLEEEAVEQLDEIRKYRTTTDGDARARAKMAIGVIGAYVRLRATQTSGVMT